MHHIGKFFLVGCTVNSLLKVKCLIHVLMLLETGRSWPLNALIRFVLTSTLCFKYETFRYNMFVTVSACFFYKRQMLLSYALSGSFVPFAVRIATGDGGLRELRLLSEIILYVAQKREPVRVACNGA